MSHLLVRPVAFENRRETFGSQYLSFENRKLSPGESHTDSTGKNELAIVVLGGICSVKSTRGEWKTIGGRKNVFDGMPYTLYLPIDTEFTVTTEAGCDLALCF